jgi:hypothetical protein
MREQFEIPIDEIKNTQPIEWYKYVRVGQEIRCTYIENSHSDLLEDGETAISAGMLKIYPGKKFRIDDYSMTLKIGPHEDDAKIIANLLEMSESHDSFI